MSLAAFFFLVLCFSYIRRWGSTVARGHWSLLGHHHHHHHAKTAGTGAFLSATAAGSPLTKDAAHCSGVSGGFGAAEQGLNVEHGGIATPASTAAVVNRSALVLTVSVDAFVDGFLIGLCAVSSATTAYVMASATALEMGFLGLAYGSVLRGDLKAVTGASAAQGTREAPRTVKTETSPCPVSCLRNMQRAAFVVFAYRRKRKKERERKREREKRREKDRENAILCFLNILNKAFKERQWFADLFLSLSLCAAGGVPGDAAAGAGVRGVVRCESGPRPRSPVAALPRHAEFRCSCPRYPRHSRTSH